MDEISILRRRLKAVVSQSAANAKLREALPERSCINLFSLLERLRLVDCVWAPHGCEFLTRERIFEETQSQLALHGGRLQRQELPALVGVGQSHTDEAINKLLAAGESSGLRLVDFDVISDEYLINLAEEIDLRLQQAGLLKLGDLARKYALPADFLRREIAARIPQKIRGALLEDGSAIVSPTFTRRVECIVRGATLTASKPVSLTRIQSEFEVSAQMIRASVSDMMGRGEIRGQLSGDSFVPARYFENKKQRLVDFYTANGYVPIALAQECGFDAESGTVKPHRAPRAAIHSAIPAAEGGRCLKTVFVGAELEESMKAQIVEEFKADSTEWIDLRLVAPVDFAPEDLAELASFGVGIGEDQSCPTIFFRQNSIIVPNGAFRRLLEKFSRPVDEEARRLAEAVKPQHCQHAAGPTEGGKKHRSLKADELLFPPWKATDKFVLLSLPESFKAETEWLPELLQLLRRELEAVVAARAVEKLRAMEGGSAAPILQEQLEGPFELLALQARTIRELQRHCTSEEGALIASRYFATEVTPFVYRLLDAARKEVGIDDQIMMNTDIREVFKAFRKMALAKKLVDSRSLSSLRAAVEAAAAEDAGTIEALLRSAAGDRGVLLRNPDRRRSKRLLEDQQAVALKALKALSVTSEAEEVLSAFLELRVLRASHRLSIPPVLHTLCTAWDSLEAGGVLPPSTPQGAEVRLRAALEENPQDRERVLRLTQEAVASFAGWVV